MQSISRKKSQRRRKYVQFQSDRRKVQFLRQIARSFFFTKLEKGLLDIFIALTK